MRKVGVPLRLLPTDLPPVAAWNELASLHNCRCLNLDTGMPFSRPCALAILLAGGAVTITATLDGATASLPVTVQWPQVQQVSLLRDGTPAVLTSALPNEGIGADALLNGMLAAGQNVTFTSSDTALRGELSNRNGPDQTHTKFRNTFRVSPGLSQARQVTVTATYAKPSW